MTPEERRARSDADALLARDYEELRAEVVATVAAKLAAAGVRLPEADLDAAYNQAWHGLHTKLAAGEEISNHRGLLVTIAHRRALDEHRAQHPSRRAGEGTEPLEQLPDERLAAEDEVEERLDDVVRLHQFVAGLRERLDRRELEAATLCYLYDYSRPEAARLLGIAPKRMEKIMDGVSRKLAPVLGEIRAGAWCESRRSLMTAYALGLLEEGGERHALAQDHLASCPACRRTVLRARGIASFTPPPQLIAIVAGFIGVGVGVGGGAGTGGAGAGVAGAGGAGAGGAGAGGAGAGASGAGTGGAGTGGAGTGGAGSAAGGAGTTAGAAEAGGSAARAGARGARRAGREAGSKTLAGAVAGGMVVAAAAVALALGVLDGDDGGSPTPPPPAAQPQAAAEARTARAERARALAAARARARADARAAARRRRAEARRRARAAARGNPAAAGGLANATADAASDPVTAPPPTAPAPEPTAPAPAPEPTAPEPTVPAPEPTAPAPEPTAPTPATEPEPGTAPTPPTEPTRPTAPATDGAEEFDLR